MGLLRPKQNPKAIGELSQAHIMTRFLEVGVYLIPVDHAGISQMSLRLVPTKNNQEKNIGWAKDYEI